MGQKRAYIKQVNGKKLASSLSWWCVPKKQFAQWIYENTGG